MSGVEAGIYALVRIESDPLLMNESPAEKQYWLDSPVEEEAIRVKMTVLRRLTNKPILKRSLLEMPELVSLSILRQPQGTIFPVRNSEWRSISPLL